MWAASDRRDPFSESVSKLGISPVIVEKDFWVCWIPKRLFADPHLKDQMVFKGGTKHGPHETALVERYLSLACILPAVAMRVAFQHKS